MVGTESFSYDAAGRLIEVLEPDGSDTSYDYDAAGRLADLRDGSGNLLVTYTYNAVNKLVSAVMGNGTSTSYSYGAAGNVTQIIDYAADDSVTASLTYKYDARSRPIKVTTLDGTWTYGYNAKSELTSAVFKSTNSAAIPDQNLSYTYDAAGNRVRTVVNGATSTYTANGLNEYTMADGSTFTYDTDGNLIGETNGANQWTFSYDEENHLTEVTGRTGPRRTGMTHLAMWWGRQKTVSPPITSSIHRRSRCLRPSRRAHRSRKPMIRPAICWRATAMVLKVWLPSPAGQAAFRISMPTVTAT